MNVKPWQSPQDTVLSGRLSTIYFSSDGMLGIVVKFRTCIIDAHAKKRKLCRSETETPFSSLLVHGANSLFTPILPGVVLVQPERTRALAGLLLTRVF